MTRQRKGIEKDTQRDWAKGRERGKTAREKNRGAGRKRPKKKKRETDRTSQKDPETKADGEMEAETGVEVVGKRRQWPVVRRQQTDIKRRTRRETPLRWGQGSEAGE